MPDTSSSISGVWVHHDCSWLWFKGQPCNIGPHRHFTTGSGSRPIQPRCFPIGQEASMFMIWNKAWTPVYTLKQLKYKQTYTLDCPASHPPAYSWVTCHLNWCSSCLYPSPQMILYWGVNDGKAIWGYGGWRRRSVREEVCKKAVTTEGKLAVVASGRGGLGENGKWHTYRVGQGSAAALSPPQAIPDTPRPSLQFPLVSQAVPFSMRSTNIKQLGLRKHVQN